MKKLKIKKEYMGLTIKKSALSITINVDDIRENEYEKYHNLGLDIFEEVITPQSLEESTLELTPEVKEEVIEPKRKKNTRKKK